MEKERFIQVGFTALRDPRTGGYLPAVPMYVKAEDTERLKYDGTEKDAVKTLSDAMGRYMSPVFS